MLQRPGATPYIPKTASTPPRPQTDDASDDEDPGVHTEAAAALATAAATACRARGFLAAAVRAEAAVAAATADGLDVEVFVIFRLSACAYMTS